MVPLEGNRYGYSHIDLGEGRFEVVYVTPSLQSSLTESSREADTEREKGRAYDLALWRAAQIANERGYDGFVVEEWERDADVSIRYDRAYPYSYGAGAYWSRWQYGYPATLWPYRYYGPDPYLLHPAYPYGGVDRSTASISITVRLTVREALPEDENVFESAATAARLASEYANAIYPAR